MNADADADARRLHLDTVQAPFDPARDLALGPWCFVGAEDVCPEWEEIAFITPYDGVEERCAAADNVCGLAAALAEELGRRLNARHGRSHDAAFWTWVLLPWLLALIQTSWLRFVHVGRFIEAHGDTALTCTLWSDDVDWNFADLADFHHQGVTDPTFDYWLSSITVEALAPERWRLEHEHRETPRAPADAASPTPAPSPRAGRGAARAAFLALCEALGLGDVSGTRVERIWFGLVANLSPLRRRRRRLPTPEWRRTYEPGYFPDAYLRILRRLIDRTMPRAYGDDFPALEKIAAEKAFVAGRLRIGTQSQWDEVEKIRAALARAAGEFTVGVQHGGLYGFSRRVPLATDFELKANAFVSWGWDSDDHVNNGNIIPLPSPMLSKNRNRHRERDARLVLVGSHARLHRFQLQSTPTPNQWVAYRKEKAGFLGALSDDVRAATLYRPYFGNETVLEDETYYRRRHPDLKLLTGNQAALRDAIMQCRLLVLDHPGTTLNIALAANVPTVCFWDPEAWPVSDAARPLLDAMNEAGILFAGGTEAARHVNDIWSRAGDWWTAADVQAARTAFCERYARADRLWWLKWTAAFWRI